MRSRVSLLLMCGALVAAIACAPAAEPPPAQEAVVDPCAGLNTLTDTEKADGWELLFDGKTMTGWHGYNGADTEAWSIEDCALKTAGTEDNYGSHSRVDLTTDEEYTDFELVMDWKATTAGNGGLIYAVVEDPRYESAWMTGPEYQLLDDIGWPGELKLAQYSGSDYDMLAASEDKELKPVGEWNTTKLLVNGAHVEHWLNGVRAVEYELGSADWKERVAASKFNEWPEYGQASTGYIGLQEHGDWVAFRNIKVRRLP